MTIETNCGICGDEFLDKEKSIQCDACYKWVHANCQKLSNQDFNQYKVNPNLKFFCLNCVDCGLCVSQGIPLIAAMPQLR